MKREIEGKSNIYSNCIDCGFKKIETIDKGEINDLSKDLNYIYGAMVLYCLNCKTKTESLALAKYNNKYNPTIFLKETSMLKQSIKE